MNRFATQLCVALFSVLSVLLLAAGSVLITVSGQWLLVSVVLAVVLILFLLVVYFVVRHFTRPLNESVLMIKQLTVGNFKMRTYRHEPESTGLLNRHLNDLGESLQKTAQLAQIQQDQLETLIENIDSSLMLVDMDGGVQLANQTFQKIFGIDKEDWFHKNYEEILPTEEVKNIIRQAITKETVIRSSLVLPLDIERRYFDIYCVPVKHGYGRAKRIVVVLHDITELKKLEKVRKDFVANVSHELKTPVTSLKGFAETLLEEDVKNERERRKFLTIIWTESERLQALIHDLLELSKIEDEQFRLNWQQVDLTKVAGETIDLLQEKANEKNIDFQSRLEGDTVIEGDPSRLKQMFVNIINNAIVYSPEEGLVTVQVKEFDGTVKFVVTDNGIGIDPKEIPRIFERFYRVDKARSRNSGGTGLGLAIVKHLMEAHGGGIDVKSQKGHGTTFEITFPRS